MQEAVKSCYFRALRIRQIRLFIQEAVEDLCFEAQQAAEKAFKAVCVYHNIEFPKTHSLTTLAGLLEQAGIKLPPDVREADMLTSYAVQARYPDWDELVTEREYQRALAVARQVIAWAEEVIRAKKGPPIQR